MSRGRVGVTYAGVVRELGAVRDEVLGAFRATGGDRERWGRGDWGAMAGALTSAEDRIELAGSRSAGNLALRAELRTLRRTLEVSLA